MKSILPALLIIHSTFLFAQTDKPVGEWYQMSATELIFSSGSVKSDSLKLSSVVRFTAFLHLQFQSHYNFSNNTGFYTGIGTRNVGLINSFTDKSDEVTIKQRSYSLGVPLAFKFGNVVENKYIALGAEVEWMFAYKMKILTKGDKSKHSNWFSSDVNAINPSVFAEIHFNKNSYIKAKYYLVDFLAHKEMSFYLPSNGDHIYYLPTSSKMFYISVGTTIYSLKKKLATKKKA